MSGQNVLKHILMLEFLKTDEIEIFHKNSTSNRTDTSEMKSRPDI